MKTSKKLEWAGLALLALVYPQTGFTWTVALALTLFLFVDEYEERYERHPDLT